jgi:uncharacterized protein
VIRKLADDGGFFPADLVQSVCDDANQEGKMHPRSRFFVWLAILFVFFGLACNPISSITAVTSNPTDTPSPAQTPRIANLLTQVPAPTSSALTTGRTVHVDALNVQSGPPAGGGTNAVDVRILPVAKPGDLHVGFVETGVGAIGAQWHASGWEAVLIASMLTGTDPTAYEFDFTNQGYIDGPSAGCLMTIAVLAALRGDTPRADATMTGTINPDGTIGPVGGIPHKMQAAARLGKKLVLVPLGQHFDMDLNTKQMVDVVAEGQALGMDVREVGNIYDAYALIVGKPLPRPVVTASTPQFPSRAFDRLKATEATWNTRYSKERAQFNSFAKSTQDYLASDVQTADQLAANATRDLNQGLAGVAYFDITDAVSRMRQANVDGTLLERYNSGGFNAALEYLKSVITVESELQAAVNQIQLQQPKTVSDLIALFDAYSALGLAEGQIIKAQNRLDALSANLAQYTKDQILVELMNISDDMTSASNYVQIGLDSVDFESGYGTASVPSTARIKAIADILSQAGEANLALFDSLIIGPTSKQLNISTDQVKTNLMSNDDDYRVAIFSGIGEQRLVQTMQSPLHAEAMVFGNAQNVYAFSSVLIAKYYSLGAQWDKNFKVTSFSNGKALGEMLDFADARAKELISLCGDEVPISSIIYYENARSLRQSNADDQVTALNYYWQAVALAQADAFLTGKLSVQ